MLVLGVKRSFPRHFLVNLCYMVEKYDGIVLRTIKYSDSLMIADIYTRQAGRRSFLLPVTRSKNSKVRNVLFQPLSMVAFAASGRSTKSLARIADAQPLKLYATLPYDVVKSSIAMFLAEVLTYSLRDEGADETIYSFIENALLWLDAADEAYADFHLVFLSRLLLFLGIYPNIGEAQEGSYFDMLSGCCVREHPLHAHFLMPNATARFAQLLNCDFQTVRRLGLNKELRGSFLTAFEEYYRLHIPDFPFLRSTAVLRELFMV